MPAPADLTERAHTILHETLGESAHFRAGQLDAILACTDVGKHTLVVQRTGWGKSLVYFIAARLLRESGRGMVVLISPLLSLMRNQQAAALRIGVRAEMFHSANTDDHPRILTEIRGGEVDLLMIAPERLDNATFMREVWGAYLREACALLVIDEIHCISDWGHDFRLSYQRIRDVVAQLPAHANVLGTTATANGRVVEDIQAILDIPFRVIRGSLVRESLQLFTLRERMSAAERLAMLHQILTRKNGSGIIYCLTTQDCERVAAWLKGRGHDVEPYYADVASDRRIDLEQRLLNNQIKALIASVALGMGFDKPDLAFVVHYQMPASIVAYYQQVGRAGRALDDALILLMHGDEDDDINHYFIDTAFPKMRHVRAVMKHLRTHHETRQTDLFQRVNVPRDKIIKILNHLELGGYIRRDGQLIELLDSTGRARFRHWKQVKQRRLDDYEQMKRYFESETCLMRFITTALDDHRAPLKCGRCQACLGRAPRFDETTTALIPQAELFLRPDRPLQFELRRQRPSGNTFEGVMIIPRNRFHGMALARYNEPPWGRMVHDGKYTDNDYPQTLVYQSARWILDFAEMFWGMRPAWVTAVPSMRHPTLVPDFARRLAKVLNLPYRPTLAKTENTPQQKLMETSAYQVQNLMRSVMVDGDVLPEPVLLVDDIVDSRWTLTYCAALLEAEGCQAVFPFALAQTSY